MKPIHALLIILSLFAGAITLVLIGYTMGKADCNGGSINIFK